MIQQEINEIGKFLTPSEKFASSANKLTVGQNYHLIKSHVVPPINYKFPTRFLHQCRRGFQSRYLSEYSWMVYSPSVDGVFCKHRALMMPMHCRKHKGAFVNKPFINWHKLQEKAKRHEQMKYYHDAMIATQSFIDKSNDVREDFIAFVHLPRITGEVIVEAKVSTLQGLGLEIENVRVRGTMVSLTCPVTTWGFGVE